MRYVTIMNRTRPGLSAYEQEVRARDRREREADLTKLIRDEAAAESERWIALLAAATNVHEDVPIGEW